MQLQQTIGNQAVLRLLRRQREEEQEGEEEGTITFRHREGVVKSTVTKANPLERTLNGDPDGLTTPFVNGTQITSNLELEKALPTPAKFAFDAKAKTCNVATPIDVFSTAEVITASDPGPKGWTTTVPYATLKDLLGKSGKSCEAKKGNIDVRMVAKGGNEAYAKSVRSAEGDHEAVIEANHKSFLKPYHDAVNTDVGTGATPDACVASLSKSWKTKEDAAVSDWTTKWIDSTTKLDGDGGPHTDTATAKVIGKCAEVLFTIKRA